MINKKQYEIEYIDSDGEHVKTYLMAYSRYDAKCRFRSYIGYYTIIEIRLYTPSEPKKEDYYDTFI